MEQRLMLSAALGVLVEETETHSETLTIIDESASSSFDTEAASFSGSDTGSSLFEGMAPLDDRSPTDPSPSTDPTSEAGIGPVAAVDSELLASAAVESDSPDASRLHGTPVAAEELLPLAPLSPSSATAPSYDADDAGSAVEEMLAAGLGLAAPPPDEASPSALSGFSANAFDPSDKSLSPDSLTVTPFSGQTIFWLGGPGLWSEATKWSTGTVPTATDHAVINAAGGYTLSIAEATSAASLTLGGTGSVPSLNIGSGGSLTLSGDLQVLAGASLGLFGNSLSSSGGRIDGTFTWAGGTLAGAGTLTIGEGAQLSVINPTSKTLSRTLVNEGNLTWTTGTWTFRSGELVNNGTATFTFNGTLAGFNADESGTLTNQGTLVYAPSASSTSLTFGANLAFVSTGIVRVDQGIVVHSGAFSYTGGQVQITGILRLNRSGINDLTLDRLLGSGTLDVRAGLVSINGPVAITTLLVSNGASLFANGAFDVAGFVTVNGSSIDVAGSATVSVLELTGASNVTVNATLTVTGSLRFNSGNSTVSGNDLILGPESRLLSLFSGTKSLLFRTVTVAGSAEISNSTLLARNGAIWTLAPGSAFIFSSSITFRPFDNGAGVTLLNQGTITVTGSNFSFVSLINVGFTNAGSVFVNSGVLDIQRAFTQTAGLFQISSPGRLNTTVGPFTVEGGELRGNGDITGSVINRAVVRPGLVNGTRGELGISQAYTQSATGRLIFEVLGLDEPFGDRLANSLRVSGASTLDGALELVLLPSFASRAGDSALLYRAFSGVFNGDFASFVSPAVPGYTFESVRTSIGYEIRSPVAPAPAFRDWDGGGDGVSFVDPLNWVGDLLPSRLDFARIAPEAAVSVTLDAPVRVGALVLGGGAGAVTFVNAGQTLRTLPDDRDSDTLEGVIVRAGATFQTLAGSLVGPLVNEGLVLSHAGVFEGSVTNLCRFEVLPGFAGSSTTTWGGFNHQQRGELVLTAGAPSPGSVSIGFTVLNSFINAGLLLVEQGVSATFTFRTSFNSRLAFTNAEGATFDLRGNTSNNFIASITNHGLWRQTSARFSHGAISGGFFNTSVGRLELHGESSLSVSGGSFSTIFSSDGDMYVGPDASVSVGSPRPFISLGGGRVQVDGTLSAADVFVSGAFFGGSGTIFATLTNSGGVVAPGSKPLVPAPGGGVRGPGELTVVGAYEQQAGGRLEVRVFDDTAAGLAVSDRLVATSATVDGTLAVIGRPGAVPAAPLVAVERTGATALVGEFTRVELSGFDLGSTLTTAILADRAAFTISPAAPGLVAWLGGDGLWTDAARWSGGVVPGETDRVAISAGTVTLGEGLVATVAALELGGGVLTGAGELSVTEELNWWAGRIGGALRLDAILATRTILAAQGQVDFGGLTLADTARLELGRLDSFNHGLRLSLEGVAPVLAFNGLAAERIGTSVRFEIAGDAFIFENRGVLSFDSGVDLSALTVVNFGTLSAEGVTIGRIEQRGGVWQSGFSPLTVLDRVVVTGGVFNLPFETVGDIDVFSGGVLASRTNAEITGRLLIAAGGAFRSEVFSSEGIRAGEVDVTVAEIFGALLLSVDSRIDSSDLFDSEFDVLSAGELVGGFTTASLFPADPGFELSLRVSNQSDQFVVGVRINPVARDARWLGGIGDWSDAANWDGGFVPAFSDRVILDAGEVNIGGDFFRVAHLSLSGATIAGTGGSLRVAGGLVTGGATLRDISLSISDDGASNSLTFRGELTFDRIFSLNNDGVVVFESATINQLQGEFDTLFLSGSGQYSFTGGSVVFTGSTSLQPFGSGPVIVDTDVLRIGTFNTSFSGGVEFLRSTRIEGDGSLSGPVFIDADADVVFTGNLSGSSTDFVFALAVAGGNLLAGSIFAEGNLSLAATARVSPSDSLLFTGVADLVLVSALGDVSFDFFTLDTSELDPALVAQLVADGGSLRLTAVGTEDGEVDLTPLINTLNAGLAEIAARLPEWTAFLGLPAGALAFLPARLDTFFDLAALDLFNPSALASALPDYAALATALETRGYIIDFIAGGVSGYGAAVGDDLIQARFTATIDLDVRSGGLDLATGDFLGGLGIGLGLASAPFTGALTLTLVFGVDLAGFYLGGGSALALVASATTAFGPALSLAGVADVPVTGSLAAAASLTAAVDDPNTRLRTAELANPASAFDLSGTASAESDLAFTIGYADFDYRFTAVTDIVAGVPTTVLTPTLSGELRLPGLTLDDTAAVLAFTGERLVGAWRVLIDLESPADLRLDGFRLEQFSLIIDITSGEVSGRGLLLLVIDGNPDLGSVAVDLNLTLTSTRFDIAGTFLAPALVLGPTADPLVWLENPVLKFTASGIGATRIAAVVDLTADRAVFFPDPATLGQTPPAGPVLAAVVFGSISAAGRVQLTALSAVSELGSGLQLIAEGEDETFAVALDLDPSATAPDTIFATLAGLRLAGPSALGLGVLVVSRLELRRNGFALRVALPADPARVLRLGGGGSGSELVEIIAPALELDLDYTVGAITPFSAVLGFTAASALFLTPDGLEISLGDDDATDELPGIAGSLDLTGGSFTLTAREVVVGLADVIDAVITGGEQILDGAPAYVPALRLTYDATAPPAAELLRFGTIDAALTALARQGVAPLVSIVGLRVNHGGDWALDSVTVTLPADYPGVFNLALIPFRLETVEITFPTPGDFSLPVLTIGGTFALDELDLGFDPVIYLGDPALIGGGTSPDLREFRLGSLGPISFSLDLGRLRLGEFAPFALPAITLGIEDLSVSGITFAGQISFGGFENGLLVRLPGFGFDAVGFLDITGGLDVPLGARLDLSGDFTFPALGGLGLDLDLGIDLATEFGGGRLELDLAFLFRADLPTPPFFALDFSVSLDRFTLTDLVIEIPGVLRLTIPSVTFITNPAPGEASGIGTDVTLEFPAFPGFGPFAIGSIELYRDGLGDFVGFVIRELILDLENARLPAAPDGPILVQFINGRLLIDLLDFSDGVTPLGAIGFDATAVILLPEVDPAAFAARGTGLDPADLSFREVTGGITLTTGALFIDAPRFVATVGGSVEIAGTGLRLDLDPTDASPDVIFGGVATAVARSLDFADLPTATVTGLFIGRAASGFASLVFQGGVGEIAGVMAFTDLALTFADVRYTYASSALSGTATLSATTATLFPDASGFTATLTTLAGTFDLAVGLDSLVVTADSFVALINGGRVRIEASDLTFVFTGPTLATIASAAVSLPDFADLGPTTVTDLVITRTGFSLSSVVFGPSLVNVGVLRLVGFTTTLTNLVVDAASGVSAGTLTFAAASAEVYAGNGFVDATLTTLAATFDLTGDADAPTVFTAATFELLAGRAFRLTASSISLSLARDDTFVFTLAAAEVTSPLVPTLPAATLTDLVVTEQGFAFASLVFTAPTAELPGLMALVDVRLEILTFVFNPASGAPTGLVTLTAASGVLFPALGLAAPRLVDDDATDGIAAVFGLLDLETSVLVVAVRQVEITLGGVLDLVLAPDGITPGLVFVDDPDAAPSDRLFFVNNATATLTALARDGLAPQVTFTEFGLRANGRYFQSGATVVIPEGYPDVLGLGGLLPLRVTAIAINFPDPDNLDAFTLSITGRFDLAALGLPFDPILFIGDPELIGTASPDLITILPGSDAAFTFALDILSLRDGRVAPVEFGPVTLGFANLVAGPVTASGLIRLGRFNASGQLEPLPGAAANVTGTLTIDAATEAGFTVGSTFDLTGDIARLSNGDTRLALLGQLSITTDSGGGELTFELRLTVSPAPFAATFFAEFRSAALTELEIDLGFVVIRADRVEIFANPTAADPRFRLEELSITFTAYPTLSATLGGSAALFDDRIEFDNLSLTLAGSFFPDTTFVNLIDLAGVLDATVGFTLSGGVYSDFTLLTGGISFTVGEMQLFPGSATFVASAQNLFGSLDAVTGELTLTAGTLQATFADVLSLTLLNARLSLGNAPNVPVLSVDLAIATLPDLDDLAFVLTNLSLSRSGVFTLDSASLQNPGGILASFGLGGLLPFEIIDVTLGFPNAGRLDGFTLSVTGAFDFDVFTGLPFTPIIRIGEITTAPGAPSNFTFTLALGELAAGRIAPLELGPIQLGFENLEIGGVTLGGTIILGGFSGGLFLPTIGGTLTLGAEFEGVSGGLGIAIIGTYDEAAGLLDVSATFSISFTLAGKIDVTDAALQFAFALRLGADGRLTLETLALTGANITRVEIRFGDLFLFRATDVALDFNPAPDGFFATFGSLTVAFPGLDGLSGTAGNFGLRADYSFAALPGFFVSLNPPGPALFGFPDWFPVVLENVTLRFADIANDPLNVSITFSASIDGANFPLPISGRVEDLTIDIGLLRAGQFPVTNLGAFLIEFGPIGFGGLDLSGVLALGLAPLDAAGNLLTGLDATDDALVAQRVLFGFIEGSVAVPGIGGLTIRLGLSEVGPLVIFVSAEIPILLEPTSGLSLLGLRGGVRFGATFPDITDPATGLPDPERLRDPAFAPAGDLTAEQWLDALRQQISTIVRSGGGGNVSFAQALSSPMLLELGATLGSTFLPGLSAAVDILISTEGALLMSGKLEYFLPGLMPAPFVLGQAKFFIDLRQIPSGSVDIAFLLDVPGDPAVLSITGFLAFDLERDATDEVIGFTLVVGGKVEISAIGLTLTGLVRLTVTTERTELFVDATLQFPVLGPLNAQGLLIIDYADDEVEVWGAFSVSFAQEANLGPLGIAFDAGLTLRFNLSERDQEIVLTFANTGEVLEIEIPALSFALFANGFLYVTNGAATLFAFDGVFILEIAAEGGLTVFVEASLIVGAAGPNAPPPLLAFAALGFLRLDSTGLVGKIDVRLDTNFPAALQLELDASFVLLVNTTGQDVTYTPPAIPGSTQTPSAVFVAGRLSPASAFGPYASIEAVGRLRIVTLVLEGQFTFALSGDLLRVTADATLNLAAGSARLLTLRVVAGFEINRNGLVAVLDASVQLGSSSADYGFGAGISIKIEINTTGQAVRDIGPLTVNFEAGPFARVVIQGNLTILGLSLNGTFGIEVGVNGLALGVQASLVLQSNGTTLFSFVASGAMRFGPQGFAAKLSLTLATSGGQNSAATGFSFTASYTLEVNTGAAAATVRFGALDVTIAGGPYIRVAVDGTMVIGGFSLGGSFILTVRPAFLELDANITLLLRPTASSDPIGAFTGRAFLQVSFAGTVGLIQLTLAGPQNLTYGLRLGGLFQLEVNTTATLRTIAGGRAVLNAEGTPIAGQFTDLAIAARTTRFYVGGVFAVVINGQDALSFRGAFEFTVSPTFLEVRALALVRVGPLDALSLDGSLRITSAGVAASLLLRVPGANSSAPLGGNGFAFTGIFQLELNTTATSQTLGSARQRVSATTGLVIAGQFDSVTLAARSFQLVVTGRLALSVTGSGFDLQGRFVVSQSGSTFLANVAAALEVQVGGQRLFRFTASGDLLITNAGMAAKLTLTLQSGGGPTSTLGFSLGANASFSLEVNTTSTSHIFIGGNLVLLPAGPFLRVFLDGALVVGGFTLEGDFRFQASPTLIAVAATLDLTVNVGSQRVFSFSGTGAMQISSRGIAAFIDVGFGLGATSSAYAFSGVTLASLRINTTGQPVPSILGVTRNLVGGNYAEITFFAQFAVFGQTFSGTFTARFGSDGFQLSASAQLDVRVGNTRVLQLDVSGAFLINASGVAARLTATLRANASSTLGVSFSGGVSIELNTTGASIPRIAGLTVNLLAGPYFRVAVNGSLNILNTFEVVGTTTILITSNRVELSLAGGMTFGPFASLSVSGVLLVNSNGIVAALDLAAGARTTRTGSGFSIDARFRLEVNTTSSNTTVARPRVDQDNGNLQSGTTNVTLAARTVRVVAAGSLKLNSSPSLLAIHGWISLTVAPNRVVVAFDAGFRMFGTTLEVEGSGGIYTGSNAGVSLRIELKVGSDSSPRLNILGRFTLEATFTLELNTRSVRSDNVAANTARISATNVRLGVAGFTLTGSVSIGVSGGIFSVTVPTSDPLRVDLWDVGRVSFSGSFSSNGSLSLAGSIFVRVGNNDLGIRGTINASFSILSGSVSFAASIGVTATTYLGNRNLGSFTISSNGILRFEVFGFGVKVNFRNFSITWDGPLAGALVVFDANRNGLYDLGEPVAFTNDLGEFLFEDDLLAYDRNGNGFIDSEEGDLLVLGGTDITTGLPVFGTLRASATGLGSFLSLNISPLTTLAITLRDLGVDDEAAEDLVRRGILASDREALPFALNLAFPLEGALLGEPGSGLLLQRALVVPNTVAPLAAALAAASPTLDRAAASDFVYRALALALLDGPALPLGQAANLAAILATAADLAGVALDPVASAVLVSAVAVNNAALLALDSAALSGPALVEAVLRLQIVAQGGIATAALEGDVATLTTLASTGGLAAAVLAVNPPDSGFTPVPLAGLVSAAQLADAEGLVRFTLLDEQPVLVNGPAVLATFGPVALALDFGTQAAIDEISVTLPAGIAAPDTLVVRTSADGFARRFATLDFAPAAEGEGVVATYRLDLPLPLAIPAGGFQVRIDGLDTTAGVAVGLSGFLIIDFSGRPATYLAGGVGTFADFLALEQERTRLAASTAAATSAEADAALRHALESAVTGGSAAELAELARLFAPPPTIAARFEALYVGL